MREIESIQYYVYEHYRADNGLCFYVGKGHGGRWKISKKSRSKLYTRVLNEFGCGEKKIIKDGLTEEEALALEKERIDFYVRQGYQLANNCTKIDFNKPFLVNHTIGGEDGMFRAGKLNPQYGISPVNRMDYDTYVEWRKIVSEKARNQVGEKNPNFGNNTLKKKLEANPELKMQYYSRKGKQNGRCRPIEVYDLDGNKLNSFDYIGECCQWLKDEYGFTAKIDSIRSNLVQRSKKGLPYKGFVFKLV